MDVDITAYPTGHPSLAFHALRMVEKVWRRTGEPNLVLIGHDHNNKRGRRNLVGWSLQAFKAAVGDNLGPCRLEMDYDHQVVGLKRLPN